MFSGREALQLKLVDQIGGEAEAVEWLRSKRNIAKSLKVVDWKPRARRQLGLFQLHRRWQRRASSNARRDLAKCSAQ